MDVKLLVGRSGIAGAQNRGDVIEVGDAEGERMIAAGQAERTQPVKTKAERAIPRDVSEKRKA